MVTLRLICFGIACLVRQRCEKIRYHASRVGATGLAASQTRARYLLYYTVSKIGYVRTKITVDSQPQGSYATNKTRASVVVHGSLEEQH